MLVWRSNAHYYGQSVRINSESLQDLPHVDGTLATRPYFAHTIQFWTMKCNLLSTQPLGCFPGSDQIECPFSLSLDRGLFLPVMDEVL